MEGYIDEKVVEIVVLACLIVCFSSLSISRSGHTPGSASRKSMYYALAGSVPGAFGSAVESSLVFDPADLSVPKGADARGVTSFSG